MGSIPTESEMACFLQISNDPYRRPQGCMPRRPKGSLVYVVYLFLWHKYTQTGKRYVILMCLAMVHALLNNSFKSPPSLHMNMSTHLQTKRGCCSMCDESVCPSLIVV